MYDNNGFQGILILLVSITALFVFLRAIKNTKTIEQCCLCGMSHDLEASQELKLTEYRENGYMRLICGDCEEEAEQKGFIKTKKRI